MKARKWTAVLAILSLAACAFAPQLGPAGNAIQSFLAPTPADAYTVPSRGASNWDEDLQTIFDEIDADITTAGSGTAKVRTGTLAEMNAYATPYDGLLWSVEDYNRLYRYEETGASWQRIGGAPIRISLMGSVSTGTKIVQVIAGESGTISAIKAIIDSGTSATITIKNGANTVYSGLAVDSSGVTQDSGLSNTTVTEYSKLQLDVTAVDGSPANLLIWILTE